MASRANIYELLDDEGSAPAPAKKAVASAPAAKTAAAAPAKKAAVAAQAPAAAAAPAQGQRPAGEKKFGADKAPRARQNPAESRDRERVERKRTDKEGGHGAGAPAGGEGRTKRVFDRQSGTGRPRTEQKKGGAGKGNWGKEEDLAKAIEGEASASAAVANVEASVVSAVTKEGEAGAAAAPAAENAAAPAEEKKPEEPVGLTLKEWKAKQAKKAVEAANVRKANEGADKKDAKKWEEFKAIDKNNAADLTADSILAALPIQTENKAATDAAKPAAKASDNANTGAKKTVRVAANDLLQLKAPAHNFDDSEESDRRGGRGGPRGPRTGGDRRGPRNDRPQGAAAAGQSPRGKHVSSPVFDESSFPSLSVKA